MNAQRLWINTGSTRLGVSLQAEHADPVRPVSSPITVSDG